MRGLDQSAYAGVTAPGQAATADLPTASRRDIEAPSRATRKTVAVGARTQPWAGRSPPPWRSRTRCGRSAFFRTAQWPAPVGML